MKCFILFLSLFFLSCIHLQSRQLASNNSDPNDQDMDSIREFFRIRNAVGNEVWPGFGNAEFRFVLVGKESQWAINVDPLPSYYQQIEPPDAIFGVVGSTNRVSF